MLDEWLAWREQTVTDLREQREERGLPPTAGELEAMDDMEEKEEGKVVEEIMEEIIQETEEVV